MTEQQAEQIVSERPGKLTGQEDVRPEAPDSRRFLLYCLTAFGVVFGDIGTSPLYALRKCFHGEGALVPTPPNVLGVLSLVFWSLITVVSVKYLTYVIRAENEGEGGILALMALAAPSHSKRPRKAGMLVLLGVFGAALIYGDGMITPAISVLSAVEGLEVVTHVMRPYVVPITVFILIMLFIFQRRGTVGVGSVFGPIMLLWFATLAVLGVVGLWQRPDAFVALDPRHAARFFANNRWSAFVVLGAVFLTVTGAEALYADLGHFGRGPIRLPWFAVVLPALLLNYFGQGALLLNHQEAAVQPFYLLAPTWCLYPLVGLAVAATVIASQAVISAAFSLSRQAVLLGMLPRLHIVFTSREKMGQIYIPLVNWMLMVAAIGLVFAFGKSTNLAGAYGVAVSTTMIITTILIHTVARSRWGWSGWLTWLITGALLAVDVPFFFANLLKVPQGGWFPLVVAGVFFALMLAWRSGRATVERRIRDGTEPLDSFLKRVSEAPPARVPGTAVFMTDHSTGTPAILRHHLEHNQVLHERVLLLTVLIEEVPRVSPARRLEITNLGEGLSRVIVHYGFMEHPDVPRALQAGQHVGLDVNLDTISYYVGRQTLIVGAKRLRLASLGHKLFALLSRNAAEPTAFYRLPPDRVFEAGIRVEIK
jgi:KUP system potassium uptake protein